MGEFAVAAAIAAMLELISDFGIGDRLVQQTSLPIPKAFHAALTLQTFAAIPIWLAVFLLAPSLAHFYNLPQLTNLVRLMSLQAFGGVLRLPLFLLYRDLEYFQHRLLVFLGKAMSFAVTISMAQWGYGARSLAFGALVGLLTTCVPAWILVAQLPAWNCRRDDVKLFLTFCWPVWASRVALIAVEQGSVFIISVTLSVQQLGQYKSAEQIAHTAPLIEMVFAQTIFPMLCRVSGSREQLSLLFSASTRAAMIFFSAAACSLLIFSHQIVRLILTPRWEGAELYLQAHAIGILLGAVAFNWEVLFRAIGQTGPIFRFSMIYGMSFLLILCPLTYFMGRPGVAAGVVLVNLVGFVVRNFYFAKLQLETSMMNIIWRSTLAGSGAIMAVLILRLVAQGAANTFVAWGLEVSVYVATYLLLIWWLESSLLASLRNTLRRPTTQASPA